MYVSYRQVELVLIVAICNRYGLAIGAKFAPLVRALIILTYPISRPVGMVRLPRFVSDLIDSSYWTICSARTMTE